MSIGEKIKERRMELRWSQRELSDKIGYSNHSTIARIESGKVDLPQSKVVKFSEVLGVSVGYLMGWEEEEKAADNGGMSESKKQLLALAEQCSEEDAEKLLQMMQILLGKK